ncbi:hypothetical protein Dip518_000494 [Parelusimicrobium proximum]|uniref:hypothetical protein n=1 Tax=Parelusimicrobium proximum TaxID=3228953 RepID=UPI003D16E68F
MKKLCTIVVLAVLAGFIYAQNILEGYAPVASPSGAYRYIRTISDTQASAAAEFDIIDIKTNAELTNTAATSELKVYGRAKTGAAAMDTLNVGTMSKTTGGYAKAKIAQTDTSASYTIQDTAKVTTYKAELKSGSTDPTLNLSNTKAFPNALPNSGFLSKIGKNMEWKTLKDTSGASHTILVIDIGKGESEGEDDDDEGTEECNITCSFPKRLSSTECKCICPASTCGAGYVKDPDTCLCVADGTGSVSPVKSTLCCAEKVYTDDPNGVYGWKPLYFYFPTQECHLGQNGTGNYILKIRCDILDPCGTAGAMQCGKIQLYECPSGYSFNSSNKCVAGSSGKKYATSGGTQIPSQP